MKNIVQPLERKWTAPFVIERENPFGSDGLSPLYCLTSSFFFSFELLQISEAKVSYPDNKL